MITKELIQEFCDAIREAAEDTSEQGRLIKVAHFKARQLETRMDSLHTLCRNRSEEFFLAAQLSYTFTSVRNAVEVPSDLNVDAADFHRRYIEHFLRGEMEFVKEGTTTIVRIKSPPADDSPND